MGFLELFNKLGNQLVSTNLNKCQILLNGELKNIILKFNKGVPYFELSEK